MNPKSLHSVFFDFDGVILDSETTLYESWQKSYAAHGCTLPLELWAANIGGYSYDVFDPLAYLAEQYGRPIDRDAINTARRACYLHHVHQQQAMPGVRAAFDAVKRLGLRLAVVSSSSRNWVHGHLKRLGLYDHCDVLACGDEVAAVKPDPELYLLALERLQVAPDRVFVVEDSPKGIAAARAAGLYCVAVPNPVTRASKLNGFDRSVESLLELPFEQLVAEIDATLG